MKQPRLFEPEVAIPEELSESVALWRAYKREQWSFTYKEIALGGLVDRLARFEAEGLTEGLGPGEALRAVRFSIQAPYKGVFREPVTFAALKEAKIVRELQAPGIRFAAKAFEIDPRIAALLSSIPSFPYLDSIALRMSHLSGEPQDVEAALAVLDAEMLELARANLTSEQEISESVEKTLALFGGRLPAAEVEQSRERLFRQALRRRLGLPVLSLFSPEAEP